MPVYTACCHVTIVEDIAQIFHLIDLDYSGNLNVDTEKFLNEKMKMTKSLICGQKLFWFLFLFVFSCIFIGLLLRLLVDLKNATI